MNKQKLNYLVDALAFISFLVVGFSGLVVYFFLPSGVRKGGYQEFWGIEKTIWVDAHNIVGLIFLVLVLIHFFLHWKWIVCMSKNIFSFQNKEAQERKKEKCG